VVIQVNWKREFWSDQLKARATKILAGMIISTLVIASSLCFPITGESRYSLADDTQPRLELTKGPYLQNVTKTTITICWETDELVEGSVEYGLTTNYGNEKSAVNPTSHHEIALTGLAPSTTYHYRVGSGGIFGEDNTFTTAVDFMEPFTFVAYGDNRPPHDPPTSHTDVLRIIKEIAPDFYINTGDLVERGESDADWDLFFEESRDLMKGTTLFPSLGNHDYHSDDAYNCDEYLNSFSLPGNEQWYSFTYGNAYFIALNSNSISVGIGPDSEQYQWLEKELQKAATTSRWQFVFFHHAPYSMGKAHPASADKYVRLVLETFPPLFERYGVDIVFSGHEHSYQHHLVNGVHYVVTAGGGAGLHDLGTPESWTIYAEMTYHVVKVRVDGSSLEIEAIRSPDATVMESFSVSLPVVPPLILSSTPTGTDVSLSTPIALTFSQPMKDTATQDAFSISPTAGGTFSWEGNTMVFTPTVGLSSGETYTVTISGEAIDLEGNSLLAPHSWQFTTEGMPSRRRMLIIFTSIAGLLAAASLVFWEIRERRRQS